MSQRASRYLYFLLLVFPFALFAPIILGKRALFWGTPLNQFIPWWTWSWESVTAGVLPIWNSMLGMGAPLIANYQSALFYPPTWTYLAAYSVGGIAAMAWLLAVMVVLHLFWASLGMALLIRELKLGRFAQIIGALAFGLSGYLVARAGFLSINAAVSWLPWIILGVTRLVKSFTYPSPVKIGEENGNQSRRIKQFSAFLLLVSAFALQLLAGHAQTAWYSLLLAILWVVFLGLVDPWMSKRKKPRVSDASGGRGDFHSETQNQKSAPAQLFSHSTVMILILFGFALAFAIGLAAVQLLPTGEYLMQSQRSTAVDYEFAMSYSFWPWRFISFLTPDLFGNPAYGDYWGYANYWEDAVYIGLIPFVLALSALITRGKKLQHKTLINSRFVGFLFSIILITFLFALGRNTPIFPWLYRYVPTFDMFQAPTRISILAIFALSILAAVGAESWYRPEGKWLYWLRLGVMAAGAITVGAGLALIISRTFSLGIRPSFIRAAAWLGLWSLGLGILALKAPKRKDAADQSRIWGAWQWAVILWVGLDLVVAGWGLNPGVDLKVYSEPSPTAEEVRAELDGGRLFLPPEDEEQLKFERFLRFDTFQPFDEGEDWGSLRASLLPNISVLDLIPSANNFDPLLPGRYSAWLDEMEVVDPETKEMMLNLMGVTLVESIDLNETYGVRFDARDAYPRFRWIGCGIGVRDEQEALDLIRNGELDFSKLVVLETESKGAEPYCNEQVKTDLRVITNQDNLSTVEVDASHAGYLIVSEVWYPGWHAFVDDQPTSIWRANYLFRAVSVPKGKHEVTIAYQPKSLYGGAIVSGLALIGLIGLVAVWYGKKRSVRN